MKILFMGTPDFALFSLKALCDAGFDVVGVVTQPDKPKGRGYVLTPPPVKTYALERGIPVYQPTTLKDGCFAEELDSLAPDLIAVVAYGKILPKYVLDYPRLGCVNVHGSLLPEYRGAAPMQRAIIDGKAQTGITTMLMAEGLDTGDMLLWESCDIGINDNFEDIHDRLGALGASLLVKTVNALSDGSVTPTPQDHSASTYAEKINKAECLVDFSQPARVIHDKIRGLSPIPLAFTHTPDGRILKIIRSSLSERKVSEGAVAGEVLSIDAGVITVACGDGAIDILRVTPEGKSAMDAADFIRGRKISKGDILS